MIGSYLISNNKPAPLPLLLRWADGKPNSSSKSRVCSDYITAKVNYATSLHDASKTKYRVFFNMFGSNPIELTSKHVRLGQCWATVHDAGPILVVFFLGGGGRHLLLERTDPISR